MDDARTRVESVLPSVTPAFAYPRHIVLEAVSPTSSQVPTALQLGDAANCNLKNCPAVEVAFDSSTPIRRRISSSFFTTVDVAVIASFSTKSSTPEGHGSEGVCAFSFAYHRYAVCSYTGSVPCRFPNTTDTNGGRLLLTEDVARSTVC